MNPHQTPTPCFFVSSLFHLERAIERPSYFSVLSLSVSLFVVGRLHCISFLLAFIFLVHILKHFNGLWNFLFDGVLISFWKNLFSLKLSVWTWAESENCWRRRINGNSFSLFLSFSFLYFFFPSCFVFLSFFFPSCFVFLFPFLFVCLLAPKELYTWYCPMTIRPLFEHTPVLNNNFEY